MQRVDFCVVIKLTYVESTSPAHSSTIQIGLGLSWNIVLSLKIIRLSWAQALPGHRKDRKKKKKTSLSLETKHYYAEKAYLSSLVCNSACDTQALASHNPLTLHKP